MFLIIVAFEVLVMVHSDKIQQANSVSGVEYLKRMFCQNWFTHIFICLHYYCFMFLHLIFCSLTLAPSLYVIL